MLKRLIAADSKILQDPEPFVRLLELADSSLKIVVRVWVQASDYGAVFYKMNEEVYKTFEQEGLSIPFPQMDVHLDKN